VDLTAANDAHPRFKFSRDGGDFLFVEAHEAGTDDWTTPPDSGGLTSTDTGVLGPYSGFDPHPLRPQ